MNRPGHFRATVFPFAVAAVLLLAITTYSAVKRHRPGRLAWALATLCMAGTFVLLPLDFVDANLAMLDPGSRHRPCPPS